MTTQRHERFRKLCFLFGAAVFPAEPALLYAAESLRVFAGTRGPFALTEASERSLEADDAPVRRASVRSELRAERAERSDRGVPFPVCSVVRRVFRILSGPE